VESCQSHVEIRCQPNTTCCGVLASWPLKQYWKLEWAKWALGKERRRLTLFLLFFTDKREWLNCCFSFVTGCNKIGEIVLLTWLCWDWNRRVKTDLTLSLVVAFINGHNKVENLKEFWFYWVCWIWSDEGSNSYLLWICEGEWQEWCVLVAFLWLVVCRETEFGSFVCLDEMKKKKLEGKREKWRGRKIK